MISKAIRHRAPLAFLLIADTLLAQQAQRSLSGTVTDRSHEPLLGAVVRLEDEQTNSVITFLTDRNGYYNFKRIAPDADYHVSATYRGHHSHTRELNHLDSHNQKVMNLVVKYNDPAH